jgi:hypothetical protein
MILKHVIKKVVIDKVKQFSDLNNWHFIECDISELDYSYDGYHLYENEWILFNVDGIGEFEVHFQVEHKWTDDYDPGDYYNPPQYDIEDETIDVEVYLISRVDGEDFYIDKEILGDLTYRLGYYIQDNFIY